MNGSKCFSLEVEKIYITMTPHTAMNIMDLVRRRDGDFQVWQVGKICF